MLALSSALERLSGRLWDERHFVDLAFGGPDDGPEIEGHGEWVGPETGSAEPPEPDDIPFGGRTFGTMEQLFQTLWNTKSGIFLRVSPPTRPLVPLFQRKMRNH